MILAGDVGATKTHLALFEKGEQRKFFADEKFKSTEFESLTAIIKKFLENRSVKIEKACFGVPGVVINGKCHPTNLPWLVDEKKISDSTKIPTVRLINDLEANAYGIGCLYPQEFYTLNTGIVHEGNQALISAGTGLGEAGLFWSGERHIPFATEGGHCSFAPENELELALQKYLKREFTHVSFERILSGLGLYRVYQFLIDSGLESAKESIKMDVDAPKKITEKALNGTCRACKRALEVFVGIYGSETGNLALKHFAVGGIYIGGGIAPKILPALKEGEFMKRFSAKGRMQALLSTIPIKIILNENTALLGAAEYARK
ncbi:MAG TPA: glucokinase [Rhabdochlamydiaceae bacterium]|nr:glucokinase [Rhabdochlamydiaceae bacterium]